MQEKGKASGVKPEAKSQKKKQKQQHTNLDGAAAQAAIPWPGEGAKSEAYARYYIARKWNPVPISFKEKGPKEKGWPKWTITLDNVAKEFAGQKNIGVQLGSKSNNLTDNDQDCIEAMALADYFLPATNAIFGRASKPRSHRLYYCDDPPEGEEKAALQFHDDQDKMIVELRLGTGSKGAQTLFPGSVHPSDEVITWYGAPGEPAHASYAELKAGTIKIAVGALLVRHWPPKGSRHKASLVIGGFLARADWELEDIRSLVAAVAKEAGDPDPAKCVATARDSAENFKKGEEHIYGLPAMREVFGEAVANQIAKHVGYRDDGSELLVELNEKFCVLPIGGKTRVVTFGKDPNFPDHDTIVWSSSLKDFKDLHDKYLYKYHDKATGKDVTVRRGSWWVKNPGRRQYDGGMRFMPTHNEPVVNATLNLWRGFSVQARKPDKVSGAKGCQLFLDHGLKIICSGNEEHFNYLIKREAYIAQKRTRSEIAVALRTEEEGTGKGFWCRTLNYLYGVHAMQLQKSEHVTGKHNPHLEQLLRVIAELLCRAGPRVG